jgi:hypothetical protein
MAITKPLTISPTYPFYIVHGFWLPFWVSSNFLKTNSIFQSFITMIRQITIAEKPWLTYGHW